jgi:pseudomonalisin
MLLLVPRVAAPAGNPTPALSVARITAPIDESRRAELTGQIHRAVRDSEDLGEADSRQRAERMIMLLRASAAQEADLVQFLKDAQTRGRPDYHRWLTPGSFAQRFGVATEDMRVVRAWLESKGFGIDEEPAGSRALIFSGTIGQVNEAFATRIHRYRWHGEVHTANATNPTVPKALSGVIAGFASLNDFRHQPQWIRAQRTPQYTSGSGAHYLAPGDFATIYDLTSPYAQGITGTGRSIAVIGRSSVQSTDLGNFRSAFGLSSALPQVVIANSKNTAPPLVPGDETESDLDLEWSAAVAPSATIKFVTTASTMFSDGVDLASQWAVSNNLADVITVSYGSCESPGNVSGGTTFYNQLWQQAAAQGTSVFVSSGDSGAAGCDPASASSATHGLGVNLLCTSPYSTCVGGTQLSADLANPGTYWNSGNTPGSQASALSYIPEVVWNESGTNLYASGGGASIYFAKPEWQLAIGVPSDGLRDVPDVALNAAAQHDPYLIYSSDNTQKTSNLEAVGGTSAAAPSMAGIAALLAQKQNGRVGNFNPVIYGLAQLQANGGAPVFHLITSGNNSVPGQTGFAASAADPTYDQASGLGSVDGANLIAHWTDYVASTAGLSPTTVVVQASATVGSATLTLPSTTSWSAVVAGASGGWLSVSPASGTGSATLSFAAAANPTTSSRSATITINGQVLTVTQAAAQAGSGNSPAISLSSSSVAFGVDQISTPLSSQRLLVSNTGNAALTLGAISLSGAAAADFSDSGTCKAGLVLNPGASCYLIVTFDPSAVGARTANLLIGISGGGSASVSLSGTGSPAAGDSDGPLPLWSYALLASLLIVTTIRRRRVV